MSLSRLVLALAVTLLAALPSTAAARSASIEVTTAGKRALKPLTLSASKLSVNKTTVGSSATLTLNGSLRFKSGKRAVRATRLTVTIGRSASYVSARVAKKQLRLLTVTPTRPASLDADRGAVTLTGARIALTSTAAKRLRTALKLCVERRRVVVLVAAPPRPRDVPVPGAARVPFDRAGDDHFQ